LVDFIWIIGRKLKFYIIYNKSITGDIMKSFLEFWSQIKEEAPVAPQTPVVGQQQVAKQAPAAGQQQVTEVLKSIMAAPNMENFISQLQNAINKPEFLELLNSGDGQKDKIAISDKPIPANKLIPTQAEIYLSKSIDMGIQKPEKLLSGDPSAIPGSIIVGATKDGKYAIIDGHHRWSQYFVFNPQSEINCKILEGINSSLDALKTTQLALTAKSGTVKLESDSGVDLMTISEQVFKDYVLEKLKAAQTLPIFTKVIPEIKDENQAVDYLWKNVLLLQSIKGKQDQANARPLMPQTGSAKGWDAALQAGQVNIVPDWLVLSGVVIRD
jgi:hypothetical protein